MSEKMNDIIKFDIVGKRKWWFALSILLIIPGIISMIMQGFNLGIDFTGGNLIDLKFARPVTVLEVREALKPLGLENSIIQLAAHENSDASPNVFIRSKVLSETERREVLASLNEKLGSFEILRSEKVGAVIGSELTRNAILAVLIASLLMIVYIKFRFEYRFAVSAIIAIFHDVFLLLGIFSIFRIELDSSFVAAILTILGYSINDTIVIFDRIRENLKTHKKSEGYAEMVNRSIWQTMTRSIYTVLTVVMAAASLYWFGGDTTKNFALALLIGFISGAYSSVFNASPIWVAWKEWDDRKRLAALKK